MRIVAPVYGRGTNVDEAHKLVTDRDRQAVRLPISELTVSPETGALVIGGGHGEVPLTSNSVRQLCGMIGVPAPYILRSSDELAAHNLNRHMAGKSAAVTVVLEKGHGEDPRYAAALLPETVSLPPLAELFERVEADERKMVNWRRDARGFLLRMGDSEPRTVEAKVGDIVQSGVDIMLRENHRDSIGVRPVVVRLTCINGATIEEDMGARREFRKNGWAEDDARARMVIDALGDVEWTARAYVEAVPSLLNMPLPLPEVPRGLIESDEENATTMELMALREKRLSGLLRELRIPRSLTPTVDNVLFDQDDNDTFFGLYNALTQLGRDSADFEHRERFERAGNTLVMRRATLATRVADWSSLN